MVVVVVVIDHTEINPLEIRLQFSTHKLKTLWVLFIPKIIQALRDKTARHIFLSVDRPIIGCMFGHLSNYWHFSHEKINISLFNIRHPYASYYPP